LPPPFASLRIHTRLDLNVHNVPHLLRGLTAKGMVLLDFFRTEEERSRPLSVPLSDPHKVPHPEIADAQCPPFARAQSLFDL